MLKTDNTWKSGIISNGRYFTYRFLANGADAIASKYVTSCVIDECGASEHRLKAGEFCKNSIELTVLTNAYTKWRGGYIQIYVSCNGSAEVPLGKYWIYEQKLQDDGRYTKLTGYDVPEYMTEKADPASTSVAAIISAIESDSGMRVTNKNVFTLKTITAFPEGTTYMQLLGYIAGYDGYNLRTDRNGNIEAYRYTRSADILLVPKEDLFPAEDLFPDHREVNASDAFSGYVIPRRNTYIGSQSYAAEPISVNSIVVTNGSDTYTVGAGTSISYENPFITSADQIDKAYLGFSYVPIDNSWRGNPAVQIGDVLMVETSEGTFQTVLVMEQKLTLDGGFSATLSCYGETDAALASVESPTMREIKAAKKTLTDALLEALTTILGAGAGYFNFVDKDGNVITSSIQDATIAGWQITDSPTVTDSTKGWRFLLGGLYYSSNGFKTAKNFALTDEGQIVANSITTGTIKDAAGNNYWNLDTGEISISGVESLDNKLNQEEILKRLTGGYTTEGLYIQNGHLYINGSAIRAGSISGDRVSGGVLKGATIVFDPDGNPVTAQRSAVGNGGVKFTGDGDFTIETQTVGITGKGTSSSENEVQLVGKDTNGTKRCAILLTDSELSLQKKDSRDSLKGWVVLNDNGVTINGSAVTINGMKAVTSNYSVTCQSGTYDGHTVLNFFLNGTYVGHTNY